MYMKPGTITISNSLNNDFFNRLDKKGIDRQSASYARLKEYRRKVVEKEAADYAAHLAQLPVIQERIRKDKLMKELILGSGITALEADKIVENSKCYDRELTQNSSIEK